MRRIQILGVVLALVLVSAAATLTLATPNGDVHKGSIGETTWFSLPEHPEMMISAIDVWRSPFGAYDFLEVYIFPDVMVAISDNEDAADWLDTILDVPGFTIVVEDDELEVWRRGKTVSAELTVTAESALFPGLTIEPLSVVFEGTHPPNKRGTETMEIPGTGYTMTASWRKGFNAFVTVTLYEGTDLEFAQMTVGLVMVLMEFSIAPTP